MADSSTFLHLARPLGPAAVTAPPTTSPLHIQVHPQAIFSILDHSNRRPADQPRVIGTLLGTRSESDESTITIHSAFAVGHTETTDQVEVDMDYQKQMLNLHLKANPKEVLVGWYATSAELNTFSALIQNFYSGVGDGTYPYPAVHMTVDTTTGKGVDVRTYISSPVGVTPERAADSAAFVPVPYEIKYGEADRTGLDLIASARDNENRSVDVMTDIESLERSIENTIDMLDRVTKYVEDVIEEDAPASTAIGQFLLNALALAPKVEMADIEKDFNNHVQDILVVSYLANTIRTQMDLSNRLATAALTMGGPETGSREEGDRKGGQRGGRQNRGQQREPREPRESREPLSAI